MDRPIIEPDEVFCAAIELASAAERAAYLDQVYGDDLDTRRRVQRLLEAHSQAGGFLAARPAVLAATTDLPAESSGTTIGPYKLLQEIGTGGMGAVWMAEQARPVQRKVALKIIKAGMDSRQVLARFEAERQAVALMDHPNIAKVFDGGATAAGRPFFVMELVKGQPITQYCDEHRLTPRERLELFVSVCQAIQHAHQKGIIHRDVKPSNVLVAPYDGRPVVKVIDFGVAKATGQRLTEKTIFTELGALVGTLEYMSPEQAELNNQDIDTRSDIYSLGVLLYELLTGSTPLGRKRLKETALLELLRIIREEETQKPSTQLSTTEELPWVAANRGLEPKKLSGLVRGELDWIVMKALDKDRNRRYETANGFAMDIQRYLADEPVQACPPTVGYKLRKFVRRNQARLAVATMVFCFIALLVAGGACMMLDRAARQAKAAEDQVRALDRAELLQEQGKRAEALAALEMAELLESEAAADPELGRRLADLKARLLADQRDQEFIAAFEDIELRLRSGVNVEQNHFDGEAVLPEMREALRRYGIGLTVMAPAETAACIQGRPEPVRQILIAALYECLRWAPSDHAQVRQWLLDTLAAADSDPWRVRARKTAAARDWKELEKLAHRADVTRQPVTFLMLLVDSLPTELRPARLELSRRIQRAYPADLWANHELARELATAGKPAEAVRYYTAALALRPANAGIYFNRGIALRDAGEMDAAIADFRQALAIAPRYAAAHNWLGTALSDKKDLEGAIREYQAALKIDPNDAIAHNNLGLALRDKKDVDGAIREYQAALKIDPNSAVARDNLGNALREKGDLEGAIRQLRAVLKIDPNRAEAHCNLGAVLLAKNDVEGAIREYQAALKIDPSLAQAHQNLGTVLCDSKRDFEGAIREFRTVLKINPNDANAHFSLGNALRGKQDLDGAIREYRAALTINPNDAWAHGNLASVLCGKQDVDGAIREFRAALQIDPNDASAHCGLGAVLCDSKKDFEGAIREFRAVLKINPNDANAHYNLGNALRGKGDVDGTIREYQAALKINPGLAYAHYHLGNALREKEDVEGAIREYRAALKIDPNRADAHSNLGVLRAKKDVEGAICEYQAALRIDPTHAIAHYNLGFALHGKMDLDGAIREYQAALKINPSYAEAHYNLGRALRDKKDLEGAIREYQAALKINPSYAEAHCNLGRQFMRQGRFADALVALQTGHKLGSQRPGWPYPSAAWVREVEQLIELDAKLASVLKRKSQPGNAGERLQLAFFCQTYKQRYAMAAAWYAEAFAAEPEAADDLNAGHRYNAACAAALAASGRGDDARKLDHDERVLLRQQALDWLRADLKAYAKSLPAADSQERIMVQHQLEHWQRDDDLSGIRGSAPLAKLPARESAAWVQLWADVESLLRNTRAAKKQ